MSKFTHVILCGGSGTRLWPLSNSMQPKQMLQLFNGKSLLQLSAERNTNFVDNIFAICSVTQALEVEKQLDDLNLFKKDISLFAEPVGRNTAGAIALAALAGAPDNILLVTPADQLIGTPELYADAIKEAMLLAENGFLVTFGLEPLRPETGYGYIQHVGNDVVRFAEKPNLELAESFLSSGDYLWNSGIFCFKASLILEEIKKFEPNIYTASLAAFKEWKTVGVLSKPTMESIPSNSIDYAVMEKSNKVKVVKSGMEWSDVGSYEALVDALVKDYNHLNNDTAFINCSTDNNIVIGNDKLVALVGVENLVVVNTPSTILIMKKGNGQEIKKLHQWVKDNKPELL